MVYCISRCLCCGLSCCCECCHCLKCCGDCCGCCDPPRGRKHKYLDEPFVPPHHSAAYKPNEPMVAGPPPPSRFSSSPFPPTRSESAVPPQYAEFDVSKQGAGGHEDALPVMPTWESAGSKKVMVEEEEVEMDQLKKKPEPSTGPGQNVPLMTGASAVPGPVSPIPSPDRQRSPYSPPRAPGPANGGYMGGASATDPYTAGGGRGYNNFSGPRAYGQSQTSLGTDQGYGMADAAMGGTSPHSPRGYNNNSYGQAQQQHSQDGYQDSYGQAQAYPPARPAVAGYDSYNSGRQGSYDDYNRSPSAQPYGRQGVRSPPQNGHLPPPAGGYPQERMGRTPPPRTAEYGGARTYSPAPMMPQPARRPTYEMPVPAAPAPQQQRQPTYEMPATGPPSPQRQPTYEMPAEPVAAENAGGGFDFGTGYSRSPRQGASPEGRREMPAQQNGGYRGAGRPAMGSAQSGAAYPGYRGYNAGQGQQQQQQGWSGL